MPHKKITLTIRHSTHVSLTQMSRPPSVCACVRAACLMCITPTTRYSTVPLCQRR